MHRLITATALVILLAACAEDRTTAPSFTPSLSSRSIVDTIPAVPVDCTDCVYGPITFGRAKGNPSETAATFAAAPGQGVVDIVARGDDDSRISVSLNGVPLGLPGIKRDDDDTANSANAGGGDNGDRSTFARVRIPLGHIRVPITLLSSNSLVVRIRGEPGTSVTIAILGARPNGWKQLATSVGLPAGISAAAHAPALNAIFAGVMPDFGIGSLWRFDLTTDTWSQVRTTNWPSGKYRKLIYDAPRRVLLTYWDGIGQVYAIPDTGGTWVPDGASSNSEQYYEAFAFFNPVSSRLSVFGGYGYGTFKEQYWEWDSASNAWIDQPQSTMHPSSRFGSAASVAMDAGQGRAFLSGRSLGATPGGYDDLWSVDLATRSWTQLVGPNSASDARVSTGMAYVPATHSIYRYGGFGFNVGPPVDGLQVAQPDAATPVWSTVAVTGAMPSPRGLSGFFYDAPRNRLVLVSGLNVVTWLNDVWAYYLR